MKIILLAAGRGRRFGRKGRRTPKCLVPLRRRGENLLGYSLDAFRVLGLQKIVLVLGHEAARIRREALKKSGGLKLKFVYNAKYREGSIVSLHSAAGEFNEDCVIMDADVYFPPQALRRLLRSRHATCFLVDKSSTSTGEEMMLMSRNGRPFYISKKTLPDVEIVGESVGFFKLAKRHSPLLKKILARLVRAGHTGLEYEESYNKLMKKVAPGVESMKGLFWCEMDFEEDRLKIVKHLQKNLKKNRV